jgi:hypothetical protein
MERRSLNSNVNDNRIISGDYLDFVLSNQEWDLNPLAPIYPIDKISLSVKDNTGTAETNKQQMAMGNSGPHCPEVTCCRHEKA